MNHWPQERRQSAIEHLQSAGWLREVQWLSEIDSTNSLARRRILTGQCPVPALLVADLQTAGRGRNSRQWWSPEGCLMFSLVIDQQSMHADASLWPQLSLIAGVASACALERLAPRIRIQLKWPNDLYIDQAKLGGILVEAVPQVDGTGQIAFIIGIGINVSVDLSLAPPEVQQRACTLLQHQREGLSAEDVLIHVIDQLQLQLSDWQSGQMDWWRQWSDRSLLTQRRVHVRLANGQELRGGCEGIDRQGCLLIRHTQGLYALQSADILRWD